MQRIYMSKEGYMQLEEKLNYLINVKRKQACENLAIARGFGDVSENGEYEQALRDLDLIEKTISNIRQKLSNAVIIDESNINKKKVSIGAKVVLLDEDGEELKFTLVGEGETDLDLQKISITSPVGKAVLNHKKGDVVFVNTPDGEVKYVINKISYS